MRITVLIDNIANGECAGEWGLSYYIEYNSCRILLDAGASGKILENAKVCGIDLAEVDLAVLSHAHYDHADGLSAFLDINDSALVYLRAGSKENCYGEDERGLRYIGIAPGFLHKYRNRLAYVSGDYHLREGVYLIPHKTEHLDRIGEKEGLLVKNGPDLVPDDFAHEQSLVFETEKGLVVFNSCSHGGVDNIIREINDVFPEKRIYMYLGGMHLFRNTEEEVRALAGRLSGCGVDRIITGHCTGQRAFEILHEELGDGVEQMYAGMVTEL